MSDVEKEDIYNLLEDFPDNKYAGVDISKNVMKWLDGSCAECKEGTLTCIPYDDNTFAVTYMCEALEHAIDIENAVKEMVRVTKSNGYVVIVDKIKQAMECLKLVTGSNGRMSQNSDALWKNIVQV